MLKLDEKTSAVLGLAVGVVIAGLGIIIALIFSFYEVK